MTARASREVPELTGPREARVLIVNLAARRLEIHRELSNGSYLRVVALDEPVAKQHKKRAAARERGPPRRCNLGVSN